LDEIDICVHGGHVLVRMVRMDKIPLGSPSTSDPNLRVPSSSESHELTIPAASRSG
jgi:hypothetical protein